MAKPNYAFAKRQRDLAKKQKKEEKKLKKTGAAEGGDTIVETDEAGNPVEQAVEQAVGQARGQESLAAEQASPLSGEAVASSRHPGPA